ncbi:MAG: tRNA dihydrouridine synthase DusB [Clostridiaceae bacterium]|nr:tRNA dihydrouridine synthase DusB [Clostridiaceae bacterium]
MAGVTDKAFREIALQFGAGLVFTEMISAKGLYYGDKKTKLYFDIDVAAGPVCAQLFGHEPNIIAQTAGCAAKYGAVCLDINSGCPTPKIIKNGDGAALMKDPEVFGQVLDSAVKNAGIPVSVKIRAGWDKYNINAVQLAKIAQQCGVCMITVHGRTAVDYYRGKADWDIIKKVVNSVHIPVIGNGDILTAQDADKMLNITGCAAVMLGRATLGNPWLIKDTVLQFEGKEHIFQPNTAERIKQALYHTRLIIKYKGEYKGIRESRKHVHWYLKGIKGNSNINNLISTAQSYAEMEQYLMQLL